MTRSEICVIVSVYAICLFFFYMTLQLPSPAQIYPLCLIVGLAILNSLYLGKCLIKFSKASTGNGSRISNDLPEIFSGFKFAQFFFVLGACLLYPLLLYLIGFYPASLIYLIAVMLGLKVKPLSMIISVVFLGCLVYGVFTLFLKVPLPIGVIFS